MSDKLNLLSLCTGNSCRSQMAEGRARHLKGDVLEALMQRVARAAAAKRQERGEEHSER